MVPDREKACREAILRALGPAFGEELIPALKLWAEALPKGLSSRLESVPAGLVKRTQEGFADEKGAIRSVASLVMGKTINHWDDGVLPQFELRIAEAVRRAENARHVLEGLAAGVSAEKSARKAWVRQRFEEMLSGAGNLLSKKELQVMLGELKGVLCPPIPLQMAVPFATS